MPTRLPPLMLLTQKRDNAHSDAGCPLAQLVIPIWVGGKANIQLDSSDGSVLRLGKRRALGYPAGGTNGL